MGHRKAVRANFFAFLERGRAAVADDELVRCGRRRLRRWWIAASSTRALNDDCRSVDITNVQALVVRGGSRMRGRSPCCNRSSLRRPLYYRSPKGGAL